MDPLLELLIKIGYAILIAAGYAVYDYLVNNSEPAGDMILAVALVGIGTGLFAVLQGFEITLATIVPLLAVTLGIAASVDRIIMQIWYHYHPEKQLARLNRKLAKVQYRVTMARSLKKA